MFGQLAGELPGAEARQSLDFGWQVLDPEIEMHPILALLRLRDTLQ
jgi:hypothetical protein